MSSFAARVFRGSRAHFSHAAPAAAKFAAAAAKSAAAKSATAATKPAAKVSPRAKAAATPQKPKREGPGKPVGILKAVPVSPPLRDFLGVPEASRTDAVKKIWDYIKQKNLQNPADKREIYCDEKLKTIFDGKDKVGFLEIGKLLTRHFVKTT